VAASNDFTSDPHEATDRERVEISAPDVGGGAVPNHRYAMNTQPIVPALRTILSEMLHGPTANGYLLNHNDPGLIRSLDKLSARSASAIHGGSASIAAHVDHLRYGFSLMNRWAAGESPYRDADWTASWRKNVVSDAEWATLRADFAREAKRLLDVVAAPREVNDEELNGVIGNLAHLGYHIGAIRQIDRSIRGPAATDQ
jgi:hypothetical protein